VKNWTVPKTVKDLQAFLGFANFYRRFIRGFWELASPLTRLTCKDISFVWTPEAQAAFNAQKEAFTTAPILTHFDPEKEITVGTDASDYVSAGVLPNTMIMVPFNPSHTSQRSTPPPNATTRFMTKNYWRSFDPLKNGDRNLKGPHTQSPSYPIIRISNTL
jgi:hypothetical protein